MSLPVFILLWRQRPAHGEHAHGPVLLGAAESVNQRAVSAHGKSRDIGVLRLCKGWEHAADKVRQLLMKKIEKFVLEHTVDSRRVDIALVFRREHHYNDILLLGVHLHIGIARPGGVVIAMPCSRYSTGYLCRGLWLMGAPGSISRVNPSVKVGVGTTTVMSTVRFRA